MKFRTAEAKEQVIGAKRGDIKTEEGFAFFPKQVSRSTRVWLERYVIQKVYVEMTDNKFNWFLFDGSRHEWYNHLNEEWENAHQVPRPEKVTISMYPPRRKRNPTRTSDPKEESIETIEVAVEKKEESKPHGRYASLEKELK